MLSDSLVKKSFKLLQFLALVGLSCQVPHGRLKNKVSSMESYAEQIIFFSVNGSSLASENSLQSSMQVNITVMLVVSSHFEPNAISFSCCFFERIFP